jgi:hypothetical protein
MADTSKKQPFYTTKTFWAGVLTIAWGAKVAVVDGDYNSGIQTVLVGIAIVTGRQAIAKVQ